MKNMHWTLLLAVTNQRVVGWKLYDKSCNSHTFTDFILGMEGKTDGRWCLLLDNAAINPSWWRMRTMVGLELWFLPPYSEYQPIEHVFSMCKAAYRNLPLPLQPTTLLVESRVIASLTTLSEAKLAHTFDHCWAYNYAELQV
jgi:hypothetical protein